MVSPCGVCTRPRSHTRGVSLSQFYSATDLQGCLGSDPRVRSSYHRASVAGVNPAVVAVFARALTTFSQKYLFLVVPNNPFHKARRQCRTRRARLHRLEGRDPGSDERESAQRGVLAVPLPASVDAAHAHRYRPACRDPARPKAPSNVHTPAHSSTLAGSYLTDACRLRVVVWRGIHNTCKPITRRDVANDAAALEGSACGATRLRPHAATHRHAGSERSAAVRNR